MYDCTCKLLLIGNKTNKWSKRSDPIMSSHLSISPFTSFFHASQQHVPKSQYPVVFDITFNCCILNVYSAISNENCKYFCLFAVSCTALNHDLVKHIGNHRLYPQITGWSTNEKKKRYTLNSVDNVAFTWQFHLLGFVLI